MYGYWAVLPFVPVLRKVGVFVTLMQFVQMVFGVAITLFVTFKCPQSWQKNWHGDLFCLAMYGVYFYLFLQLLLAKAKPATSRQNKKQ